MKEIYLDPDGTWGDWLAIVVAAETGVVYTTQCQGVACDQRSLEGYLVPVAGLKRDPTDGHLHAGEFRQLFHRGKRCQWNWVGDSIPTAQLESLAALVESVPYWMTEGDESRRGFLRLDSQRTSEIAEAWVPVVSPDGPAVLVWDNCD